MKTSKRRHEGYMMVDHRESPAVPVNEAMIGKPEALMAGMGNMLESATVTCAHCQVVVILNPLRTRPRGYCQKCDRYICDNAGCHQDCTPFEKMLDEAQERALKGLAHSQIIVP